jgi:hypothetical protein
LAQLFCCFSNGTCTFTVNEYNFNFNPKFPPINCTDALAAASHVPQEGKKIDLGILDSLVSPYTIRIGYHDRFCRTALLPQSFPMNKGFYCVDKQALHDAVQTYFSELELTQFPNLVYERQYFFYRVKLDVYLDNSYGNHTIKYDFVSPER